MGPYGNQSYPPSFIKQQNQQPDSYLGRRINYHGGIMSSSQESVIVPLWQQVAGEYPQPSYVELRDYYLRDPDVYQAVNYFKNKSLANGYTISCNPDAPDSEEAAEFLTDWLRYARWGDRRNERGFESMARIIFQELGWGGSSVTETLDPDFIESFAQLQLSSIWRVQRNDVGQLTAIWQMPYVNPQALTPSRYIIWAWNLVDRDPFGKGLVHSMAQYKIGINGGVIPPLILMKWQIEDDIRRRLHRYGSPRAIYGFKGLSRAEVKPMAEELTDPNADVSLATNVEPTIAMDSPTGRANFGPDLDFIHQRFMIGFGDPLSKLMGETGFSYASAEAAERMANILVWDGQQAFKLTVESEILGPVLQQNGFDSEMLEPQFDYNIPEQPEQFNVSDLINAATPNKFTGTSLMSRDEFREIAKDWLHWDLDLAPELPGVNVKSQQITRPNIPTLTGGITRQLSKDAQNIVTNSFERFRRN